MSDLFAYLNDFGVRDVSRQVLGEESVLGVELRLRESKSIVFEESARLDVDEAGPEILNSDVAVFININVFGEGVQDFPWPLLVYLHLEEVGEFLNGYQIADWILQSLDQRLDGQVVALEEELDARYDGLEWIVLFVAL